MAGPQPLVRGPLARLQLSADTMNSLTTGQLSHDVRHSAAGMSKKQAYYPGSCRSADASMPRVRPTGASIRDSAAMAAPDHMICQLALSLGPDIRVNGVARADRHAWIAEGTQARQDSPGKAGACVVSISLRNRSLQTTPSRRLDPLPRRLPSQPQVHWRSCQRRDAAGALRLRRPG